MYRTNQNTVFLVCFSLLAVFSAFRVLSSFRVSGARRVITLFNALIFASALLRVLLFLLPDLLQLFVPNDRDIYAETVYGRLSSASRMHPDTHERLLIWLSQLLLSIGNWSLYGVFILIACYWTFMLKKLYGSRDTDAEAGGDIDDASILHSADSSFTQSGADNSQQDLYSSSMLNTNSFISRLTQRFDTIELFQRVMAVLVALELMVQGSYLWRGVLLDLLFYDSLLLATCAVAVLVIVTFLSTLIHQMMSTMEFTNRSAANAQIKRIYSIIQVANLFFYTRVVLEGGLALYIWYSIIDRGTHDFLVREPFWTMYVGVKHGTEIVVLVLELLVSTAIRSYENPRVTVRQVPRVYKPGLASYHHSYSTSSASAGVGRPSSLEMARLSGRDFVSRPDIAEESQPILQRNMPQYT